MSTKKKKSNKKSASKIEKIKVLKAERLDAERHRIALELEVRGAPDPPAVLTPEEAVEISSENEPQLAAHGGWVAWLKSLW